MKVRRFGTPKPAQTPTTPSTQPATSVAGRVAATEPALVQGALRFPRVEGLADKTKAERARTLLETLRAPGGDAFGGRVRGGVDVAATLKAYFGALDVASVALGAGCGDAVAQYIEALDVPDDIRPLVSLAVGDVSARGPLGSVKDYERDKTSEDFWEDWQSSNDPNALRVTDATVKAFFGRWGEASDIASQIGNGDANLQVGVVKLFARAKELGLDVTVDSIEHYTNRLPADGNTAAVLSRFARAFDIDPSTLTLGGRPLSQWQPRSGGGDALGNVDAWEHDSGGWSNAVTAGDKRAFEVTDATLTTLANDGYNSLEYFLQGPDKTHLDGLRAFARTAAVANVDVDSIEAACDVLTGSKDVARALQKVGKAAGVDVDAIVLGDKSVADWIAGRRATPESAKKPLGAVRTFDGDHNYNRIYASVQNAPASVMGVSDATVKKWFGAWRPNAELTAYWSTGTPESRVAFALWWARGKELGLPATCAQHSLDAFAGSMPETAAAARALRRLGRAFGINVEGMSVGGVPMSSFSRARSRADDEARTLPARPELGDERMLKPDLKRALEKKDAKLFSVDDASLKRLLAFDGTLAESVNASRDRAWKVGVLGLAERAIAIGAFGADAVEALVAQLPRALLDEEPVSEAVARLVVKSGASARALLLSGGESLSQSASTMAHVVRLERILEGTDATLLARRALPIASGPLGNRVGPHSNYWARRDPAMFDIDDASIRNEMMDWGDFSWLSHWRNAPGVISLIARIVELNREDGVRDCPAQQEAESWLAEPIPEVFGTADALPRIVRLCRAAGVDPNDVVVEHGRSTVPLLQHPATPRASGADKASVAARAASLADDMRMLSPAAKRHPAEREDAALHLLGVTDPERPMLHELPELLGAALQAMTAGELARIDVARLPAKHRDAMLATAFESHDHPAAIALLAGVFFDVDAASIEKLLLSRGHLATTASAMGAVAHRLAKATPAELAFCAMGLDKEPPELSSLPERVWLLGKPAPDEILAKLAAKPEAASSLCAAVLERATLKDTPAATRDALFGVVDTAEQRGLVERADVVTLLSDAAKRALDGKAIAAARDAAAALLGAPNDPAARAQLEAALSAQTWSNDPNVLAEAALDAAAALDGRYTASLAVVDADRAVVGKAWQTRLSSSAPTVDVYGVKLPLETADGKAPRVRLPAYPAADGSAAQKALQHVATRLLAQRPFSIVDVDGAAALRAVTQATGARVDDVVIRGDTPVDALFGPAGAVSAAIGRAEQAGGVVHLALAGDAWPDGLADALKNAVEAGKVRVVTTGPALPGLPALPLPPLDAEALTTFAEARGLTDDQAQLVGAVLTDLKAAMTRGSALPVIERVAARMKIIKEDGNYTCLQRALADCAAPALAPGDRATLDAVLRRHIGAADDDAAFEIARRTAHLGDVPFKIVAPGVKESDVAAVAGMTDAERVRFRAAAWALEVKEPVAGDADSIERTGIAYGEMTGRDVHVHFLHEGSKPSDVLSKRVGDVVLVAHGFLHAPSEVRDALVAAARDGNIRLLVDDAVDCAFTLDARGNTDVADVAARARALGQALGLPSIVAERAASVVDAIQKHIAAGTLEPLSARDPAHEIGNLLELVAELAASMPIGDAFVSAVSATYPMSTAEQQEQLEADARAAVKR